MALAATTSCPKPPAPPPCNKADGSGSVKGKGDNASFSFQWAERQAVEALTRRSRPRQVKVEAEIIISLVCSGAFAEVNEATSCLPGKCVCRTGIDKPVVAPRIVGRNRVARDLHVRGFGFPVGSHVDPVLGAVTVVEMHDQRAQE